MKYKITCLIEVGKLTLYFTVYTTLTKVGNIITCNKSAFLFWGFFAASIIVCILINRETVKDILAIWETDEYSYAYFVPFLSVFFILHLLSKNPPVQHGAWIGVVSSVVLLSLLFLSLKAAIPTLPQYFFLALIYSIVLSFLGWRFVWVAALGLAFLVFAIPLPQSVFYGLSAQMQLISSNIGVFFLHTLGISAFQEGNIIDLGVYKLQVEEACNGLRYLFPLMCLGFLFLMILQGTLWKRVIIFVSTIPIAIFLNALRITTIGIFAIESGSKETVEAIHDIQGWVMFILCIMLLFGEVFIFQRFSKNLVFNDTLSRLPGKPFFQNRLKLSTAAVSTTILLVAFLMLQVFNVTAPEKEIQPGRTNFDRFPTRISTWSGRPVALEQRVLEVLNATDVLNMSFHSWVSSETVELYIAYYNSQRSGKTFHSPSICMPGSGWETVSEQTKVLELAKIDKELTVNRLIIKKGLVSLLVYYWYDQRGETETSYNTVKSKIIMDSILHNRTDGALVRLLTPIADDEDVVEADKRLKTFIQDTSDVLPQYVPDYSIGNQSKGETRQKR